jgi:hypothetical protein
MRNLKPFDVLEVKLHDNTPGQVQVLEKSTTREIFPVDMV